MGTETTLPNPRIGISACLLGQEVRYDGSCGMVGVKAHHEPGAPSRDGRGLFAEVLMARLPELPVEEEGRLKDPDSR